MARWTRAGDLPTNGAWEPPAGQSRAAGGLLGVLMGAGSTAAQRPTAGGAHDGTVTSAVLAVGNGYVARRGAGVPRAAAMANQGVPGPAWLLPVAIVRPDTASQVADALELAAAAGISRYVLGHCVTYVELAGYVFSGRDVNDAVTLATGHPVATFNRPRLVGEPVADAITVSIWALLRHESVARILPSLDRRTTVAVRAAAAGLVGLRDGLDGLPTRWHHMPASAECMAMAPGLVRARYLHDADQRRWVEAGR